MAWPLSINAEALSAAQQVEHVTKILHDKKFDSYDEAFAAAFAFTQTFKSADLAEFYALAQQSPDAPTRLFVVMNVYARTKNPPRQASSIWGADLEYKSIFSVIVRGYADPSPVVRKYAFRLYDLIPSQDSVGDLTLGLRDKALEVRAMCVQVLQGYRQFDPDLKGLVDSLATELLKSQDPILLESALKLTKDHPESMRLPALRRYMATNPSSHDALEILAGFHSPEARNFKRKALQDSGARIRTCSMTPLESLLSDGGGTKAPQSEDTLTPKPPIKRKTYK